MVEKTPVCECSDDEAQSNRSRDTIHEYLDILKKSPEDAAQFLQRTVDFLEDAGSRSAVESMCARWVIPGH